MSKERVLEIPPGKIFNSELIASDNPLIYSVFPKKLIRDPFLFLGLYTQPSPSKYPLIKCESKERSMKSGNLIKNVFV